MFVVFFSSRRRHTRYWRDWSSDVCSSDLTEEMDRVAEEGVAAHWAYKEKRKTNKEDQIYGWLRNIIDLQQNTSNTEDFVKSVTADIKDRKSTRLNSSHANISYAVFCLKKKNKKK